MTVFIALSKYLIILLSILYVLFAYFANSVSKKNFDIDAAEGKKKEKLIKLDKKARAKYVKQINTINGFEWFAILSIHLIGYVVICCNTLSIKYIVLYLVELVFLLVITKMYNYVYNDISKPLYNNMIMLIVFGLIMIARLNFDACIRQFAFIAATLFIGLFVPFIVERFKSFDKLCIFFSMLGIAMLGVVLVAGTAKYGARNWLVLGPIAIQPSEFVKIIFVFAIAGILNKGTSLKRVFFTSAVAGAHVLILVAEKDLGGALLFFMTYLIVLYIATNKLFYLISGTAALAVLSVGAYFLFAHVRIRVLAFKDPFAVIDNEGYQLTQSLFAIGSGGWFGSGLNKGLPESVPVVISDFIFSGISEEMGAITALCIIIIYICCFIAFINVALKLKDSFHKLLAMGLTTMFIVQVILTLGGVTGFIPSTGVTLPLISQGGSSAVSTIIMFSVIQGLYAINENGGDSKHGKKAKESDSEFEDYGEEEFEEE